MIDRIKLAEARGWHGINDKYLDRDTNLYVLAGFPPDVKSYGVRSILPDPENDANDCEALIRCLQKNKHETSVYAHRDGYWEVELHPRKGLPYEWKGSDWKQGVCELALKVLAQEK